MPPLNFILQLFKMVHWLWLLFVLIFYLTTSSKGKTKGSIPEISLLDAFKNLLCHPEIKAVTDLGTWKKQLTPNREDNSSPLPI
ncbi:hypothetical protein PRUPE_1G187800 [Prunus persica]|uniref:Uncharacterized protein n=1 Tax=Prunus persica TaxID=3760 RepID=A0A251QZL2_PRUPE|nr:hypothetical protein PRUPE_1G187800 [Prunus persica]